VRWRVLSRSRVFLIRPHQPRVARHISGGHRESVGRTPNDAGSPWAVPDVAVDEEAPLSHPTGPASISVLPRYFTLVYRNDPASVYQLSRGGEDIGPYGWAEGRLLALGGGGWRADGTGRRPSRALSRDDFIFDLVVDVLWNDLALNEIVFSVVGPMRNDRLGARRPDARQFIERLGRSAVDID